MMRGLKTYSRKVQEVPKTIGLVIEILLVTRNKEIAEPRHVAIYLAHDLYTLMHIE